MPTIVCFHAHPDDECIATGGVMARASAEGHRVVLVTATRGEHGEVPSGFLAEGESLTDRRVQEVAEAARILGVHRHEFLGYVDSGMMGVAENDAPASFWRADVDEAAARLAAILTEERADVLTIYDDHGGYGHPDHIKVHQVGVRAADLAGTSRVYEATIDRDRMKELLQMAAAGQGPVESDSEVAEMAREMGEFPDIGSPSSLITTRVDVTPWIDQKRRAMRAHASQIPAESFFLALPDDAFAMAFGVEAFIRRGGEPGIADDDLLAGLG
ncbi:MAG: PIG-L family deacetylase [Acidimicrobiales bacterium]